MTFTLQKHKKRCLKEQQSSRTKELSVFIQTKEESTHS